jgi:hypothetical protein
MPKRDPFARVLKLGLKLPGVEESTSYGTPSLKVRGKFLMRMKEDGETLAMKVADLGEKDFLRESAPEILFTTDHYNGYAYVLIRLAKISDKELAALIERAWWREAGKKLLAELR